MAFLSGLVDTIFGGGKGKAGDSAAAGYDAANARLQPYTTGGAEDYNKYRDVISKYGAETEGYGNPYDWMWKQAGKNPQDFLRELTSGYSESPMAKYAQEEAIKSATQGASASGMLGSGALLKLLQRNAYDISARDQDRYLGNVLGVNNRQQQYGENLQRERGNYRSGLWNLADLGFRSADRMGQNDINRGKAEAYGDEGRAGGWQNALASGLFGVNELGRDRDSGAGGWERLIGTALNFL